MTTTKYGMYSIDFSVQGWDTIINDNTATIDSIVHTNLTGVLGETVGQYKAVGLFIGETKYKKAQANGVLQPALGITLVSGVLDDSINIQRDGPVTNAGWSWIIGKGVYLDPNTAGELTQNPSGANRQFIGMPASATTLILSPAFEPTGVAVTTTTTSTTTTTTV